MKRFLITILSICSLQGFSQETSSTTTSMPFLLINSDARSAGMGDNGVATSSDAFSIYHNPAKTAFNSNQTSAGINYTPWLRNLTGDIFVGGASFINRFKENASWGIDFKYFSLGKIDLNEPDANDKIIELGTENPSELAITGIYSLKLSETYSMGVGLKYINSNYKINSTNTNLKAVNTFAVDVSGYYQSEEENFGTFNGRYRLGFNIANIGPKVSYTDNQNDDNFIPTNLKLGGGFDFIFDDFNNLGVNLQFNKLLVPSDNTKGWIDGMFSSFGDGLDGSSWSLGAEYKYNNAFAIRTGYFSDINTIFERSFLTLGAGFQAKAFSLDLSYLMSTSNINDPLENTLRFSLAFDFGEIFEDY